MLKSKILFIVTGSIAAYKSCQVISRLVQSGHDVEVVATAAALQFVGAATFEGLTGNKVSSDLYEGGQMMAHIQLARWADLIVCAPATANFVNKIAHGLGDDLASTIFLAHDFKKPFLLAPAMNTSMYLHPLTQKSITTLKDLGVEILETASGVLACGETGLGKLLDPELILSEIISRLSIPASHRAPENSFRMKAKKILITAGGTTEAIDSVRSISNLSTGRTGFELAQSFSDFGHEVTLLQSMNSQYKNSEAQFRVLEYKSYSDLRDLVQAQITVEKYDFMFHLAAVSDYSLSSVRVGGHPVDPAGKLPSDQSLTLDLQPNPKIIDSIKSLSANPDLKLVGFKLTANSNSHEVSDAVMRIFSHSHSDFVVQNDLSSLGPNRTNQHSFQIFKTSIPNPTLAMRVESTQALSQYFLQEIL